VSNGNDSKYRSRKWILAVTSLVIVTVVLLWGVVIEAEDAKDVALLIGAWLAADTLLVKIYSDANVAEKKGGGK
jgi:hypothetical protein